MAGQKRPEEIGTPDPDNEPLPPRIRSAGELGEVGEKKMDEGLDKKGIWGHREPPEDIDPAAEAARTPAPAKK